MPARSRCKLAGAKPPAGVEQRGDLAGLAVAHLEQQRAAWFDEARRRRAQPAQHGQPVIAGQQRGARLVLA